MAQTKRLHCWISFELRLGLAPIYKVDMDKRIVWLACLVASVSAMPEQVHLALGKTDDSMSVAWVTADNIAQEVQWLESGESSSSRVSADTRAFTQDHGRTWYTHVATMTNLKRDTVYQYRVGSGSGYTEFFNFTNRRAPPAGTPYKHIILGDMGSSCAFTLCKACTAKSEVCDASTCKSNTSVGLIHEAADADMILHLGDFAYDLDGNDGKTGDQFMRNIEQVASHVPYMVSHGNHEDGAASLAHYIERFRLMPSNAAPNNFTSKNGPTTNSLYFSWDIGLVHYVSMSTELFFGVTDGKVTKDSFIAWLKNDLEAANKNRDKIPWIVVQGHRSIYCSCDGDCDEAAKLVRNDLEEIFFNYGVDFFINGHEHNYERSYPIYKGKSDRSELDPKATIYIVSGSAGSREMHEPFTRPQPTWSAFRSDAFSYSILWAYNSTHIHWQQIATDPTEFPGSEYGKVLDEVWFVQHNHGPFNLSLAPKGEAFPHGRPQPRNRQHEHWWPHLNLEDGSDRPTDEIVREFRSKAGEKAWAKKMNGLMDWVHTQLGADIGWKYNASNNSVVWEDVRDNGASDCATCPPAPLPMQTLNFI